MPLITIASETIPNWQGVSDSVSLFILNNGSFTAQSGTFYPTTIPENLPYGGRQSVGTFYQTVACTVSSGSLVVPSVTLDSTTDSPDNPSATYSAVLFDTTVGKIIQSFGTFPCFPVLPSPTTTTWAAIFAAEYAPS